jgi:RNA polymerase sigma-70 factor (ECF subfamily)
MSQAEISIYRPILCSIAYKIVGCSVVAEDMVQDTFLNWLKIDQKKIVNVKAYLIKSVTNACLNYLDSFKQKKEEFLENICPSVNQMGANPDIQHLDLKHEVTLALTQLYKKLPPTERAVFVLKGIFNFDYSDLNELLGKKSENCRQLFCRAQQKLVDEKTRFAIDKERIFKLADDFKKATLGEFSGLIESLKKDISIAEEK